MFDSQSSKINKSLLQALKEGISRDKEEISKLVSEEKSLREEIASENKNIKGNKLEDKKDFLKDKINGLKNRIIKINDEIKNKNELLKAGYASIKLLEEEISNKRGLEESAKNKFNENLAVLLKNKNNSIKYLMQNKEALFNQVSDLKKENSTVRENIKKSRDLIEKQFENEAKAKNEKISELEKDFKKFVLDKNQFLSLLKQGISNEEKKLVLLENAKNDVSKKFNAEVENLHKKLDFQKLAELKNIEKQITELNAERHNAEARTEDFIKVSEAELNKKHAEKLKSIEGQITAEKKRQDSLIFDLQKEKENISKQISVKEKEAEEDKKKAVSKIEGEVLKLKQKKRTAENNIENTIKGFENKVKGEFAEKLRLFENEIADEKEKEKQEYSKLQKEKENISIEINKKKTDLELSKREIEFKFKKDQDQKRIELENERKSKIKLIENSSAKSSSKNINDSYGKIQDEQNRINAELKENEIKNLEADFQNYIKNRNNDIARADEKLKQDNKNIAELELQKQKISEDIALKTETEIKGLGQRKRDMLNENNMKFMNEISKLDKKKQEVINALCVYENGLKSELEKKHSDKLRQIKEEIASEKEKQNRNRIELKKEAEQFEKEIILKGKEFEAEKKKTGIKFENEIFDLKRKEAEISKRIEVSLAGFENKLKQERGMKLKQLEKEIVLEKEKQRQNILNLKKRSSNFYEEINSKQKKFVILKDQTERDYKKKYEIKVDELNRESRIKLANIQKNIVLLNSKIKENISKIKNTESAINFEIKEKQKKYLKEKELLSGGVAAIKNKEFGVSKEIADLKNKIDGLNKYLPVLRNKTFGCYESIKAIDSKIALRGKHLAELNKIISDKQKIILDKEKMQKELNQLMLIVENKLKPVVKWKTRTKETVKFKTKWKDRIVEKIKFRTRWKERVVNKVKWKIKQKLIKRTEKQPPENKAEMEKFLKEIDSLLGKLPKEEIDSFAKSKEFKVYKKIMNEYGIE